MSLLNDLLIFKKLFQQYCLNIRMESTATANRRQLSSDCNALELNNGKATSLMGLEVNEINTNSYLSNSLLIRLLFKLFNPCPLSLIVSILITTAIPNSEAYSRWMYVSEFILIFTLIIIKEYYFDMMRSKADEKINQSKFIMKDSKVYRDGEEIVDLNWGQVQEGDILYLQKGEKAPADLLVLDTQHIEDREAIVYVDARSITGKVTVQRKKACYLTQVTSRSAVKRNWDKYKKEYLTGKLKYEHPNPDMQDFLGYLKLVKDPKTSLLNFQNFISRESVIKTCWVYALVVNAGMNCKIMRHIGERNRNHKFFQNYIDRLFAVCLIINLLLGLPFALLSIDGSTPFMELLAYHFIEFSLVLPHFLFLGNGLLLLYFSFKNKIEAEIINFSSVINLGSIDYAVMAYTGVLSSGKMNADQIITSSSLYDFREQNLDNLPRGSRRNGSLSTNVRRGGGSRPLMSIYNSTLIENAFSPAPLQRGGNQFDSYFLDDQTRPDPNLRVNTGLHASTVQNYRMHLQPLRISKQKLRKNLANEEEEAVELMKAFALCHEAILKSQDSKDIKFQANSKIYSEEVLLRLVNSIGVHVSSQIDSRTKKEAGLRIKLQDEGLKRQEESKEWFFSRRQNTFQIERRLYSVVTRQEGKQRRWIYVKGPSEDMLDRLKDKQMRKNIIENKISTFKQNKAEILIYGKREMSKTQYEIYENEYTKLKMSSSVSQKDMEDFSTKFQQDLQFVCMVGLSSEKSEAARQITQYFSDKGIKMCIFTNNLAEVQSLKSLLEPDGPKEKKDQKIDYVELESKNVEEIAYNLNAITRKLASEKQYLFSIILGPETWRLLKIHSYLMQHFLLAVYYSSNVFTHEFTSHEKAEITQKLKRSYNRPQTIMSIGSSYSDLLFQNFSDVSLIISSVDREKIHSDIPSDIRAPNISSLKKIIELGSWVTRAYSYLVNISIYRSTLLGTLALILQTVVFATQGTSYNLDTTLIFFYVVIYGSLETIFIIKLEQRKSKEVSNDYQIKDKKETLRFWTNVAEGLVHGVTIGVVVLLTLPNARLAGGKLFPVEAIHFSVYFLMVSASILRHLVGGECSRMAVGVLALISYPLLLGAPWLFAVFMRYFSRTAVQMGVLWTCYDTVFMMINVLIFCLASSLFISQSRKKGIVSILLQHFLKLKKENVKKSKQLLQKDINHIQLIKHLFVDEQNIEDSIQELVGAEFDTNQLKINALLEIKKAEHRIKNQFNNVAQNLSRFELTLVVVTICFVIDVIHGATSRGIPLVNQIPLLVGILFLVIAIVWFVRADEHLGRKYYKSAEICITLVCITTIIYEATCFDYEQHFLLTCLFFVVLTQLTGIRLNLIIVLSSACFITGTTAVAVNQITAYTKKVPLQILLMGLCGVVNIAVLYGSTFDSRKNFILRQQIEMQTNQTNDIWTILVPEFVRNFFSDNGEDAGQYKEKSVAILFCYVCNFDSIIEEEGRNVVRLLDNLYREFDKLCSSFAVQKIETVGYTYMAATGIRKIETQMENEMVKRNKVERLLGMAQQMLEKTKMFKWGAKKNKDLDIKIGIHVGEVVVGVIGRHKKQFSLIGTNVNATSRHGSTGKLGSITLSRQARGELHNFPDEAFEVKEFYMKGLCKTKDDTIPVFTFKIEEGNRRTVSSNSYRLKFKKLVMKVIRSQRIEDDNSSQDEEMLNALVPKEPEISMGVMDANSSNRDLHHRTTCRGLENNFNKIEQMKNRDDQIKCYSTFLEFSHKTAKSFFSEAFPSKNEHQIEKMIMKESQMEEAYNEYLEKNRGIRDKVFIGVLFFLNICLLMANILLNQYSPAQIGLRATNLVLLVLLFFLSKIIYSYNFVSWVFIGVFLYLLTVEKIDQISGNGLSGQFSHYYCMMIITLFTAISGMRFLHSVVIAAYLIIFGVVSTGVQGSLVIDTIYEWFYVILVLIRKYVFQKESIINFRQGQKTTQISKQLSKIVSELLPKHAYQKLKTQNFQNRLELTDMFEQCTILFADIKGFTQFSDKPQNREEPQNVVRMLRSLFQEFDVLCTDNNVYKLYTIGDCYVVLGFTNCYDRNPKKEAENVVNFAFDMIKMIEKVKREKPELSCLHMRIGVHTGTIIGGIVGTEIVRYDIYGSDVVVANKFEETGQIGKIHISEQTKKLLDQLQKKPYSENNIEPSERVEVKRLNVSYGGYLIKRGNLS